MRRRRTSLPVARARTWCPWLLPARVALAPIPLRADTAGHRGRAVRTMARRSGRGWTTP